MRRRHAFTLVELLVVIGIIALLISILMPSLSRARMAANLVACQSNMKQVATAIHMYANEYKGVLPEMSNAARTGSQGVYIETWISLSRILGKNVDNENDRAQTLSPVFTCTEASPDTSQAWAPHLIRTTVLHPRAFPDKDGETQPALGYIPGRKLSSIRNSSEKIMAWEGQQIPWWNMSAEPTGIQLDGYQWNWGAMFRDPVPDSDTGNSWANFQLNDPADMGTNADGDWGKCSMRFRHMKNTMAPLAYFDGHVEAKKAKEVLKRETRINP